MCEWGREENAPSRRAPNAPWTQKQGRLPVCVRGRLSESYRKKRWAHSVASCFCDSAAPRLRTGTHPSPPPSGPASAPTSRKANEGESRLSQRTSVKSAWWPCFSRHCTCTQAKMTMLIFHTLLTSSIPSTNITHNAPPPPCYARSC